MLASWSGAAAGRLRKISLVLGILLLVLALATRQAWLVAALGGLGAMVATLVRFAPVLLPLFPLLRRFFRRAGQEQPGVQAGEARMGLQEAYEILGLEKRATREQIIAAHRRLIQKVHPDRGGSDYLAVKINQARDTLLGSGGP